MFKKLFCKHEYSQYTTIRSKRVGNDNHVIEDTLHKCVKCGTYYIEEAVVRIEDDWYIK